MSPWRKAHAAVAHDRQRARFLRAAVGFALVPPAQPELPLLADTERSG